MPSPGEDVYVWSVTAIDNGTFDPLINWQEHQTRASVNNSARSEMAAHAKFRRQITGAITTGGTANAQTFASGNSYTTIPTGMLVKLKLGFTNTASTTLAMDSLTAVVIKNQDGSNLSGGELIAGNYVEFRFDGTNWIMLSANFRAFPLNTRMLFQQTAAPTGWTKITTETDKVLRLVNGAVTSGGVFPFSTVFNKTTTGPHSLTVTELGPHWHTLPPYCVEDTTGGSTFCYVATGNGGDVNLFGEYGSGYSGSGVAFTMPMDIRVQYSDVIIARKD